MSLPITFAYVIPGIGTNWLRLWEFNTRFRLGRFRPHHGLVFGTATSLLAMLTLEPGASTGVLGILRGGFVLGSVLVLGYIGCEPLATECQTDNQDCSPDNPCASDLDELMLPGTKYLSKSHLRSTTNRTSEGKVDKVDAGNGKDK